MSSCRRVGEVADVSLLFLVSFRTDKAQSMRDKVEAVERLLAMDEKGEGGE